MVRAAGSDFLHGLPTLPRFAEIVDPAHYAPLPDGWIVGLADVVRSTEAIGAGRYKAVNMAGAAVISAVSNALGQGDFPFAFGGDGATFAVGPRDAPAATAALAATATFVREDLDLELRVGTVPVAAIRAAGLDVRVARFAASPSVAYAMFSGGGIAWAEARLKSGGLALAPAPPGSRPDLSGLSCRFAPIRARRGLILSLIVRPAGGRDTDPYRGVIQDLLALTEGSAEGASPLPAGGPEFGWPPAGVELEARIGHRAGASRGLERAAIAVRGVLIALLFKVGLPLGRFDPKRYMSELVANSDYRKYDDGLRMTIDCSPELAAEIETRLVAAGGAGIVEYGLHRQDAALMTCFTPSVHRDDHIHFVDGAAGGYAAAAAGLKAADPAAA